ncbi:hypothetical protein [Streptomyces sp. NPDC052107]|uniref:hypothetical protein n=1 Tax=Streptomyces sp. NPDC052107 TaxID=3155632 RepID=UPI00343F098A
MGGRPYTVRMVAVAQLNARDFPEIRFPDGTDLVQLLWCPDRHDQPHPEGWGQACRLFWPPRSQTHSPEQPFTLLA